MVEHLTFNQVVRGSNPRTLTQSSIVYSIGGIFYADVAELADALDLGSSSSECRFDSCHPHYHYLNQNRTTVRITAGLSYFFCYVRKRGLVLKRRVNIFGGKSI